ncbi:InlB B-repeat-containing protein [Bifidobacterium coryneforme]|uniref:RCC1 domain-containing protein n=1 Tax=Bifidobacterium coryneforme TaxID=1687 RepID=UPI0023F1CA33|nr:InlB B-repeat-containing protein [Bifidobacterium coryneforme]
MPSPTATPQSPAAATQATTATASPTPLATPNPLTTRQSTAPVPAGTQTTGAKENPAQARTGSHTVTFTSQPDTQGMPASQTIPDGKTATWPHDDPTRPGWTFNGWFIGDLAYDFTRPVTQDLTLTAKWGKWATGPDKGPWHGGTNVKLDTPGSQVRLAQVTLGDNYCLGLGSDGNAYAWGEDQEGRMGMGSDQSRNLADARMITMPEGVKFTQVAAGSHAHSIALDRDGRVWTWGSSSGGVLGRPTSGGSVNDSNPGLISVPEGVKFTQVAAGSGYSMALDQDGKVWTWGINSLFKDKPGTLDLPAAIAISAKMSYGIALAADGTVWTWGEQTGRATYNLNPHLVDTDTRFTAISVGWIGFIAIARDRTVWTWMDTFDRDFNHANDLRIAIISLGRTIDDKNPADRPGQVPGLIGAFQLGASTQNAVITDTGVWAWGFNREGQLGNGTTNRDPTESVITRFANPNGTPADFHYVNVALDYSHAALIGSDGEVYTCGRNDHGELGNGAMPPYGIRTTLPIRAWRPVDRDLTKVLFGETRNIGGPYRSVDGWHATSPRHDLGTVTLTIQSTVTKGTPQPDETSHRFTYTGDTATVTFKTEHGSPIPSQQVIVGDTARRPDNPATDDGWTFNGWFQGDRPYDFTKPINGDTVLTARWGRWKADPAQGPWRGGTDVRIDTPTAPVRFTQVAAGQSHSLAVGSDGNLYAWGNNTSGQLGDDTTTNQTTATKATTPAGTGFIQAAAGGSHSMALDRDGRVWTWGSNEKGQLGRNPDSGNSSNKPGQIASPAGVTFIAISAGTDHSMAIDNEGNTWTWGDNQYQQLGYDTGFGKPTATPKSVDVPEATFASVSAGTKHSIGLDINGTAWTWGGSNTRGTTSDNDLLGHDNPWNKPWNNSWLVYVNYAPTAITEERFIAVSAGNDHSAGVTRDGTVRTWGHNDSGQLGRTPTDAEPAWMAGAVPGVTGATGISTGRNHSAALTDSGIWTWGGNQYGQLGTSTGNGTNDGVAPARMPNPKGTPSGFTYTSLSTSPVGSHTLAVGSDWDVYAFGANDSGQLGTSTSTSDGNTSTAAHPNPAMVWRPVGSPVTGVLFGAKPSASQVHRRADGWHAASPRHRPEAVALTIQSTNTGQVRHEDTSLRFMYTGDMATLTFTSQHGRTPDAQQVPAGEPTRRPEDPSESGWTFDGWFDGDVAYDFTQPLEHDLTVTARWHRTGRWTLSPDHGSEYGDGTVTLTAPAAPDIRLASVDTGGTTSLGIGSDGQLYAWGDNAQGQLGDGTTSQHTTPVRVAKPDGTDSTFTWVQAAAGRTHSAAVGSDGQLYTWGDNTHGQLGDGTTTRRTRPVKAARPNGTDTGFTWVRAAAGGGYTMALGSDDNLYAWGTLTGGLGDTGRTASSSRPVRVALPQDAPPAFRYEQITAGDTHAAAIGSDGQLYTWGANTHGQLGHDDTGTPAAAAAVASDPRQPAGYVQASAGGDATLAIDRQGRLWAWGRHADGTDTTTPTRIRPAGTADTYRFTHTSTGRNHSAATGQDHRTWTWGDNTQGQLGHTTGTPTQPTAIPGLNTTLTATGGDTTIAIDTNGDTQAWGNNTNGQAGHGDTNPTPTPRKATIPPQPTPTGLTIDNVALPLRQIGTGTWQATTIVHDPGPVPAQVRWTLAGQPQPDDTSNTYTYRHTGSLPNAGGAGIILLVIAGSFALATAKANRHRHNLPTTTNTSPE